MQRSVFCLKQCCCFHTDFLSSQVFTRTVKYLTRVIQIYSKMAQGKTKVKAKLPAGVKTKKSNKGPSISKRANCPIAPKKKKFEEVTRLRKIITKTVNQTMEDEMRSRAANGKKNLTKVEQAVVAHNTQEPSTSKK